VGVSVAPVVDQHLYDTIYQERYMGLPKLNSKGYRAGSPIHFARGLNGKLLLIHGMADDNCHCLVTELLVRKLMALGKSFEFTAFPDGSHSLDDRKGMLAHLYELIARHVTANLHADPR
jgi:dipeptidyl-peptidase-4